MSPHQAAQLLTAPALSRGAGHRRARRPAEQQGVRDRHARGQRSVQQRDRRAALHRAGDRGQAHREHLRQAGAGLARPACRLDGRERARARLGMHRPVPGARARCPVRGAQCIRPAAYIHSGLRIHSTVHISADASMSAALLLSFLEGLKSRKGTHMSKLDDLIAEVSVTKRLVSIATERAGLTALMGGPGPDGQPRRWILQLRQLGNDRPSRGGWPDLARAAAEGCRRRAGARRGGIHAGDARGPRRRRGAVAC